MMPAEFQPVLRTVTVREITPDDAAAYIQLRLQIDAETRFMIFQAEPGSLSPRRVRSRLELILSTDNQTIFVAEEGEQLVGFLCATGGVYRHDCHNVQIVVGVRQAFTCQGIGTRLLGACECWARAHDLYRLELSVMTYNHAAVALYTKLGFEIDGLAKAMLRVDDEYVDLYYMSKVLV